MGWIYLAGLWESPLPWHPSSSQSPTVNRIDTAKRSCCPECAKDCYRRPQCGTTCEPLTPRNFLPSLAWTSSLGDSHARISAVREMESAWRASEAGFSLKSQDWLASFDRDSSSWKTCQLSLLEDFPTFVWPSLRWGTIVDGRLYQPTKLEPRISVNDGSFFATPTTKANQLSPSMMKWPGCRNLWPTPVASEGSKGGPGRKFGDGRPTLSAAVHLWTTPTADDTSHRKEKYSQGGTALSTQAGGQLNPTWVEWLMGYRNGWTVLEDWATQWFLAKRGKRSKD